MSEHEREFKLSDFFRLIHHRKAVVIGAALILGVFLTLAALAGDPIYEAKGSLQLTNRMATPGIASDLLALAGGSSEIISEIEIIRSRSIADYAIDELDLRLVVTDVSYGGPIGKAFMFVFADRLQRNLRNLRVDKVEFPQSSIDKNFFLTFTDDSGNFTIRGPQGDLGAGHVGEPFVSDALSLTISSMTGPAGSRFKLRPNSAHETLFSFQEQFKVATLGMATRTNLISVSFKSNDPTLSCDVVNAVIGEYERRNSEWKKNLGSTHTNLIETRITEVIEDLSEAEADLEQYKNEYSVVSLPDEARLAVTDLSAREAARIDTNVQISILQNIHAQLAANINNDNFSVPPALTSEPLIAQLASDHARAMVDMQNLLLNYTEEHPTVVANHGMIMAIRQNILDALSATINGLVEKKNNLNSIISASEERISEIPGVERELVDLTRRQQVAEQAYLMLLQRLEQNRFYEATFLAPNRIIDNAVPPAEPVAPSISKNLGMGLGLGFILGILLAVLIEIGDKRFRRTDQLEGFLNGHPVAEVKQRDTDSISHAAGIFALALMKAVKPSIAVVCPGRDNPHIRKSVEEIIADLARGINPVLLVDTSTSDSTEPFFSANQSNGLSSIADGADVKPQVVENGRILVLPTGAGASGSLIVNPLVRQKIAGLGSQAAMVLYYASDFAHDPALRCLNADAEAVVVVIHRNQELMADILRTFDILASDSAPVLGAIIID